jgi:hypothetical protein
MPLLCFTSVIKIRDVINPYIPVTSAQAKSIKPGWRKPLPVLVRINGKPAEPWRINMMPVGDGSFYLYLHGPQHPVPLWFKAALQENPRAAKNWEALIPSRRKEILRYFARLKSPEARAQSRASALRAVRQQGTLHGAGVESGSLAAAGLSSAAATGRSDRRRTRAAIPRVRRRPGPD